MSDPLGTRFETEVLRYLRDNGIAVERLAKAGKNDEGDLVISDANGDLIVAELKARRSKTNPLNLGGWLAEAEREAAAYAEARGSKLRPRPVLIAKRSGKGVKDAFVVMRLETFIDAPD